MTIRTGNLEIQIATTANTISASTENIDILRYTSAFEQLKTSAVISVPTVNDLPPAGSNTLGQLYFVEADELTYYVSVLNSVHFWKTLNGTEGVELYSWGAGAYQGVYGLCRSGVLGDGVTEARCCPGTTSGGGTNWCSLATFGSAAFVGLNDSFAAIKSDGTLWTWGGPLGGKLGNGTNIHRSSPGTTSGGGTTWCQVAMGLRSTSAVKTDGTLWTWGNNTYTQLGDGTNISRCSPGTTAGGGTNWCQAGGPGGNVESNIAVKQDGTLWTWGRNCSGRLGDGSNNSRSLPGTTAGGGTNWCLSAVGLITNGIAAGIKTDGTLWTWGSGGSGQLGDGSQIDRCSPGTTAGGGTTWCFVNLGSCASVALKTDGTLWAWGSNLCGVIGDGTNIARLSPVTTAGGGTDWLKATMGSSHTAALKTDGTLWTWGNASFGSLGTGSNTSRSSPGTTVSGGTDWVDVKASTQTTFALKASDIFS